jgi:hypothetical protein
MHISPISAYRSNPQNSQAFTGLNLKKGVLYGMMGLSSLGIATSKVAAQTAKAVDPICHAVDSFAFSGNKSLKLYVAGRDSTTFDRILGYLYDPAKEIEGRGKRLVEVLMFEPDKRLISLVIRGENGNGITVEPSPKIEAYLRGNGRNQAGKPVKMASDCNIDIIY